MIFSRRVFLIAAILAAVGLPRQTLANEPIVIGVSAPLHLQPGRDALDGAKLALEEINAKGGILGRPIKLVFADEGLETQEAVASIRKLISTEKPDLIIGSGNSGIALAQMPHVMSSKTLFFTISSAAAAQGDLVRKDRERNKYLFRVAPLNSTRQVKGYVDLVVEKVKGDWGFDRVAIVGQNNKFVQDIAPAIKAELERRGIVVTRTEIFEVGTTDFSPVFSRIRAAGTQFMLTLLIDANADVFVKQWFDLQLPIPIGGLDVKSQDSDFFSRIGGKAVSEIVGVILADVPLTSKSQPFWRQFSASYGRPPIYTAGAAYDSLHLYAAVANEVKQISPDALIPALEKVKFVGVAGGISFDDVHDVKDGPDGLPQPFLQWQTDGTRTVVWPPERANGKLILPPWMKPSK